MTQNAVTIKGVVSPASKIPINITVARIKIKPTDPNFNNVVVPQGQERIDAASSLLNLMRDERRIVSIMLWKGGDDPAKPHDVVGHITVEESHFKRAIEQLFRGEPMDLR